MTMPFHQLLAIFEAVCHKAAKAWIAGEPNEYTKQERH